LENIFLAFITGITTGGLSCLAVQGGLLASSLAQQIEKDVQTTQFKKRSKNSKNIELHNPVKPAKPILVFLIAKLIAYTALGFLLGWVGQMTQLSPITRAILQILIGIFMLGSALRMLNVHPIFRFFVIEPPAFLRRWIRNKSKESNGSSLFTPAFMGLLTVLIPCGVTQAMMAVALATGNPLESAILMFAFTLGTTPVFFVVSYFATRLGAKLEKYFVRIVAVLLILLSIITINSGLTLAGSPLSFSSLTARLFPQNEPITEQETSTITPGSEAPGMVTDYQITIKVKSNGYEPDVIHAKAGVPITLLLTTENVRSCSRAFTIPTLNIQQILAETGELEIEIPAQEKGTWLPFSCSMGMYTGTIIFDL
jgi:sulfite exporter TauE/SafE